MLTALLSTIGVVCTVGYCGCIAKIVKLSYRVKAIAPNGLTIKICRETENCVLNSGLDQTAWC